MDVIIKETGEHKQLTLSWPGSAGDWADEIIGQSGAVGTYIDRDDDGTYHMDHDSYQWWEQYLSDMADDLATCAELSEQYGKELVDEIVFEEFDGINDYDLHHAAYARAFSRIREEGACKNV